MKKQVSKINIILVSLTTTCGFITACASNTKPISETTEAKCNSNQRQMAGAPSCEAIFTKNPVGNLSVNKSPIKDSKEFRELTNPEAQGRVKQWVSEQNQRTEQHVKSSEIFTQLESRAKELAPTSAPLRTSFEHGEIVVKGGKLTWLSKTGEKVILDPKSVDPSGETQITEFKISPDSQKIAAALTTTGADVSNWNVYDIATASKLNKEAIRIRYSGLTWGHDSNSLLYGKWPDQKTEDLLTVQEKKRRVPVYRHNLGTELATDKKVLEVPEYPQTTVFNIHEIDGDKMIAYRFQGAAEIPLALMVKQGANAPWKTVKFSNEKNYGKYVGLIGEKMIIRASEFGSNFGIAEININTLQQKIIIPASKKEPLITAAIIDNKILTRYLDAELNTIFRIFSESGELLKEFTPEAFGMNKRGDTTEFTLSPTAKETYFSFSNTLEPHQTFALNMKDFSVRKIDGGNTVPFDKSKVSWEFKKFKSFDGQEVPIQVFKRTDTQEKPKFVYLYYYGSIGIPTNPLYNRTAQLALDMGGMVAFVNIRGGGEYGMNWQFEPKRNRMISIKDITWASRWLKSQYEIEDNRVVISGRSFGGMHTFAAYTHFPNDFTAFVPVVPVTDAVSFLKGGHFGWMATDDFGIPRNQMGMAVWNQKEETNIRSWEPFSNIKKLSGQKAKPLIAFSGSTDERVNGFQNYVMVYELQKLFGPDAPVYTYEHKGGHSNRGDFLFTAAFLAKLFDIKEFKPLK